ncbi:MAG: immunity 7 family protein [Oscillospiraceae bacterium]|nr:immunity 7 family protein [Oscillospiraceae bacterium]
MVELHGWALIRQDFTIDNEDENLTQIVGYLKQEIAKLGMNERSIQISFINGEVSLTATNFTNHFTDETSKIIDLFNWIARKAPGSYGLLYLHDDEDANGFSNAFQVFVLARGTFQSKEDPFLSPYIPTVEDEE